MTRSVAERLISKKLHIFITLKMNSFYFAVQSARLNLKTISRNIWIEQEGLILGLTKEEPGN